MTALAVILIAFIVLLLCGVPIWIAMAMSAIIVNAFFLNIPGTVTAQGFFTAVNNWPLVCVPFFLLSGNLMGVSGPANALFSLCDKFVGHIRGGVPMAVVAACCMFGSICGSGVATAVAIGSLAIPEMLRRGYKRGFCYGLVGVSGTIGLMIPPSVYMILFAGISNGDVLTYFTAGYLPGIFMGGALIIVAVLMSDKSTTTEKASWKERGAALKAALPALGMPVLIMGAIYLGIFTPTESAAISVVYTIIICPLAYKKDFTWDSVFKSARKAVMITAQIYVIVGAVNSFSAVLTYLHVPQSISEAVVSTTLPTNLLVLMMLAVYFVMGMFIDAIPIMYLTVPIFLPIVMQLGVPEAHFMVLTITLMMIGQVTPPFGIILFTMNANFNAKLEVVIKGSIPFIIVLTICAVILIVTPQLSTFLPELILGR